MRAHGVLVLGAQGLKTTPEMDPEGTSLMFLAYDFVHEHYSLVESRDNRLTKPKKLARYVNAPFLLISTHFPSLLRNLATE